MKRFTNFIKEYGVIIVYLAFMLFTLGCTFIPWLYGVGRAAWEWATAETIVMP